MSNQNNDDKFFDFHSTGLAYLNKFREVKPKQGKPYYAVTLAVLRGNSTNVKYTWVDCTIPGDEALNVLLNFVDTDEQENGESVKYLASVKIGDLYADPFIYKQGPNQGKPGASLKARLLQIRSLKRNGEDIYKREENDTQQPVNQQPANQQPVNQQPANQQPANQQPVDQQPVDQQQVLEVFLSQEDPQYDIKKETLQKQGYTFNGHSGMWQLLLTA